MPINLSNTAQVRYESVRGALKAFAETIPPTSAYTLQEVADAIHHHPDTIRRESQTLGVRMRVYVDGKPIYVVANPKTVKEKLDASRSK